MIILRRALIGLIIIAVLAIAAVFYVRDKVWFWQWALIKMANGHTKAFILKDFHCERIDWKSIDHVRFVLPKVKAKINGNALFVSAGAIDVRDLFNTKDGTAIEIVSAALVSDKLNASTVDLQMTVRFKGKTLDFAKGRMTAKSMDVGKYEIHDIQTPIELKSNTWVLDDLQAGFIDGLILGSIAILPKDETEFNVKLQIKDIDTRKLQSIIDQPIGPFSGVVEGAIDCDITGQTIKRLHAQLKAPKGGEVQAQFFSDYSKMDNFVKKMLKPYIAKNQPIVVDQFDVTIDNTVNNKYLMKIRSFSKQLSVNFNVDVDMNIQEGLVELILNNILNVIYLGR